MPRTPIHEGPITDSDREAARRALARNWPDMEPTDARYASFVEILADFHRAFGTDSFELRYKLRPPKDRVEQWTQQHMHGEISDDELRDRLKADAERPVDLEMLTTYCETYQERLKHYSGILQAAVLRPSEESEFAWRERSEEIETHVTALDAKYPLWSDNLLTVAEFLEECRVASGAGLVVIGEFHATSAHWLVQVVFRRTIDGWRSCVDISERSYTDPRYLYSITAADLFHRKWLQQLPPPQVLSEHLRHEFILARSALRDWSTAVTNAKTPNVERRSPSDWELDNESRELQLIGDFGSIVGAAGHIFRPTPPPDWGIDGEIEFKDQFGRATGQRVYVQLKSGDSYLLTRKRDGVDVFSVKKQRHLEYWCQQAYPVMLVVRQSDGTIRWMDVRAYLREHGCTRRQIAFQGLPVTPASVRELGDSLLRLDESDAAQFA